MAACKKVTLGKRNQSRKEVSVQTAKLIFWVLLCQLPAWAGMGAVSANMDWYHALLRPSFTPPDWMFGAAWSVLYLLLGAVGFLITKNGFKRPKPPHGPVVCRAAGGQCPVDARLFRPARHGGGPVAAFRPHFFNRLADKTLLAGKPPCSLAVGAVYPLVAVCVELKLRVFTAKLAKAP